MAGPKVIPGAHEPQPGERPRRGRRGFPDGAGRAVVLLAQRVIGRVKGRSAMRRETS